VGSQLKNVQENIKSFPKPLQKKFDKEIFDIKQSHEKQIGDLEKQLENAKGQSQIKIDEIKDKISDIEAYTNERISHIKDISDKLQDIRRKGKILGVLGLVGATEIARKGEDVKRLLFHVE
jgi:wobble nucleotide-excising tRNase